MKKQLFFLCFLFMFFIVIGMVAVNAENNNSDINILLNGKIVIFNDDTGYPYVDENNRTMVPLRVTMESAGFVVGYDAINSTAIVITDRGRIEVPIGTNIIYYNNIVKENDTIAVIKSGRTYLPIRAVLEAAHYTVEWDGNLKTVNAYTYNYEEDHFSPYSAGDLGTLIDRILSGDVVYINGGYYATPEFVKRMHEIQVIYTDDDLNTAIYPQPSRYDFADIKLDIQNGIQYGDDDWISESDFWRLNTEYNFGYVSTENGLGYGFVKSSSLTGIVSEQIVINGMPLDFADNNHDVTEYDGIRVKCVNTEIFLNISDLKAKGIIK